MAWLIQQAATLNRALGIKRYIIGGTITVVLTALAWIRAHIPDDIPMSGAINAVLGLPIWAFIGLTILIILLLSVVGYATKLRLQIEPKIKISLDPSGSIVQTPQEITDRDGSREQFDARYFRGLVTTSSEIAVEKCSAYLTEVTMQTIDGTFESTKFLDAVALLWTTSEHPHSIRVAKGAKRYFDLLHVNEHSNYPQLAMQHPPFRLLDLFAKPGTYRLNVVVTADGAQAEAAFEFTKGEKWDDLTARQI